MNPDSLFAELNGVLREYVLRARYAALPLMKITAALVLLLPALSAVKGESQTATPVRAEKPAAQGQPLTYSLGAEGLRTLTYNGMELLAQTEYGALRVAGDPTFRRADGSSYTVPSGAPAAFQGKAERDTITRVYAWGALACNYTSAADCLHLRLRVSNRTHETLTTLRIQIAEPTFPTTPQTTELDAGMFGTGGRPRALNAYPLVADPRAAPPLLCLDYGSASVALYSDDLAAPVILSVPYTVNPPANTRYPLWVTTDEIAPGETRQINVSLRFGRGGASGADFPDVLRKYAAAYPYQVHWNDRRPIGTLFLSSLGTHPATNPRGWFNNAADVDVTTVQGLAAFRLRLLRYADESIGILKGMNAQGMIAWDPEGQEFGQSAYNGDPRLTERLAPETAYKGEGVQDCLNAFFQKFRDAGLRVGICVRPQEIEFVNGVPRQTDAPDPAATLQRKIAYARKRWGCTLFYVDSTVKNEKALDAEVFRQAHAAFPDVLLMPENETLRYFAYSAPLNSFQHHSVTSTPPGARAVYPRAFSVLLAGEGDINAHRAELVAAVRRGDILLFHGWWPNPNNTLIKSIYEEAGKPLLPERKGAE